MITATLTALAAVAVLLWPKTKSLASVSIPSIVPTKKNGGYHDAIIALSRVQSRLNETLDEDDETHVKANKAVETLTLALVKGSNQ
jgi:hypothetical protein